MTAVTSPESRAQPGFIIVVAGYIAAVAIASLVVVTALAAMAGGVDSRILAIFAMGCAYTFGCAFPGFVVTVLIAYCFRLRVWLFFVIAGGLDGILALAIFHRSIRTDSFALMVVAGGLAGGLVYWLLAYRLRRPSA